jgi:hypothetical protein
MARQRLRPDAPPLSKDDIKAGQQVFREWCGDNGICVDVLAAADLCKKISVAIARTRMAIDVGSPSHPEVKP